MLREYQTYKDFFPYYLSQHAEPGTRTLHYIGSVIAIAVLIWAIASQTWWALLAVPVAGYSFAWVSHAFVERNKPATWTYPLWSLMGDYHMLYLAATGGLDAALKEAGVSADEAPQG